MNITVIIPLYNEEESIGYLLNEIKKLRWRDKEVLWEFLFVDDGSTDGTSDEIDKANLEGYRIIKTPHLGLSNALYTGINEAKGDIIVTIDADGQFSFEDIPRFVETLIKENADIVTGYRIKRDDNILRRWSSNLANAVKRFILNDKFKDSTCTLKAFKKDIRDKVIFNFDGFHRFIPSFADFNGLKIIELPVLHRKRIAGEAKFGILNRLPDVLVDVLGVRWLKYKRFSQEADIRRYSFYPDIVFLILLLYVVINLFYGYFRVVDDFWFYGSLNRFIGYDYSKSYGWENFIFNEIVPPLVRIIYAVFLFIGKLLNVRYPLEWANKVIGSLVLLFSYIVLTEYFKYYLKVHFSKWISVLIVFFGISGSEIYSGFARSFSFILIPLLLISLERRSLAGMSMVTVLTALIYPVLLPLNYMVIIVFFVLYDFRSSYKSIVPIFAGFIGLLPMLFKIDLLSFSPPKDGDLFLKNTQLFDLSISSDLALLSGSFMGDLINWINFNLLHQWILGEHLHNIIGLTLGLIFFLGIIKRFIRKGYQLFDLISILIVILYLIISLAEEEYTQLSYTVKWGIFFLALYFLISNLNLQIIKKYRTVSALVLASILSFIITYLLSQMFGFGVHEPGRQLQRPMAIVLPLFSGVLIYYTYIHSSTILKNTLIFILTFIAILYFPQVKLISPVDKYVVERINQLPKGTTILSHPLTANWIVTHTNKYSTIIDEQIRVTKGNPIRGSTEKIMPTEMAAVILGVYYSSDMENVIKWCSGKENTYILVEEYYFSEGFLLQRRDPYFSYIERNNKNRDFVLLRVPLYIRHYITPESFLLSCTDISKI